MYIQNEALLRLTQQQSKAQRESDAYEKTVGHVAYGYLNSYDVLRLFGHENEGGTLKVGARAREIISEKSLPLMELGDGRFVVNHGIMLPEVDE